MTQAFDLLRFRLPDPVADAALELAALTGDAHPEAVRTVDAVLDWYHFGRGKQPIEIDRTRIDLVVHLTQPFRIPFMTSRMDRILERAKAQPGVESVLDYGGGGGKDAILYARSGFRVTYADLVGPLTPYVQRRFELRGLDVRVLDVRDPAAQRFDAINCMDVIEHVYDVEDVVADLVARLDRRGHLFCYPAFFNTWDGDHVEKNSGYRPYFTAMLESVGLSLEDEFDPVDPARRLKSPSLAKRVGLRRLTMRMLHLVRERPVAGSIAEERETIRTELYRQSRRRSARAASLSLAMLPLAAPLAVLAPRRSTRRRNREALDHLLDNAIDNLAIWRLSRQRLASRSESAVVA